MPLDHQHAARIARYIRRAAERVEEYAAHDGPADLVRGEFALIVGHARDMLREIDGQPERPALRIVTEERDTP